MRKAQNISLEAGVTLLEILVVIACLAILVSVSISSLQDFARNSAHKTTATIIVSTLQEAHAKTLASENDTTYGVHIESSQVALFSGATYVAGDPLNDVRLFAPNTGVTSIVLAGGAVDVVFSRLTGTTSSIGTITVSMLSDLTITSTITVHSSGLTEISG
jgi:Tfp pilus assembly protein FimT